MTGHAAARNEAEDAARRRLTWAWTGAGYAFFAIGLLGTLLPVLPTTIFGIIAAAVGLKIGLLTQDLYAVILLVIVGSAILPAVLLRNRLAELK